MLAAAAEINHRRAPLFSSRSASMMDIVSVLIILVHVMAAAEPAMALKLEPPGTRSHIPPILDCAPARSGDHRAFRSNVLAVLGELPAVAAVVPEGFAVTALQSGGGAIVGDDHDRAFARAFCFGFDDCLECLSAAAQDVADRCHGRRGAAWRAGCFLSYADTDASTPREDAFRGWFYDDSTTAALGACAADRTTAECSRCLNESAHVVPALKEGRQLSRVHCSSVVVVGYSCYLRVPLFPPATRWLSHAMVIFDVVVLLLIEIAGILCCIRMARHFNPAA